MGAKALLLDAQIDSELEYHRVSREVHPRPQRRHGYQEATDQPTSGTMKTAHFEFIDADTSVWHLILDTGRLPKIPPSQAIHQWQPSEPCSFQLIDQFRLDLREYGYAVFRRETPKLENEDTQAGAPMMMQGSGDGVGDP